MRQFDDGSWQITELANLKKYIKETEKAKTEKLIELNIPLQEKINTANKSIDIYALPCNLNPFVPKQKIILQTPANNLIPNLTITKIKYTDDKEISLCDSLPG